MDLTLLNYFYVVANEGSFMSASQKLGYAQSNLSTRIRQFEESFGTELFYRSRNGVTLTEKGKVLYDYADKLLSLSKEAEGALSGDSYTTRFLNIAAMESATMTFLPDILSKYHKKHEGISIRIKTGTSDAGIRRLLENEVDLAFAVGENKHEGLISLPVRTENLVLITGSTKDNTENEIDELLGKRLLVFPEGCAYRRILEALLMDKGISLIRMMEFTSLGAILASISAGLGSALFPESVIQSFTAGSSLRTLRLPEKYQTVDIYLLYRSMSSGNNALKDFINLIQRHKEDYHEV